MITGICNEGCKLGNKPCCSRSGRMVEDLDSRKSEGTTESEGVKTLEGTELLPQRAFLSVLPT